MHRNRERVADLLAAGALECDTPAALAARSEIVFVCVTGSPQVEATVGGLLEGARAGLVVVDCSTSEPESSARSCLPTMALLDGIERAMERS